MSYRPTVTMDDYLGGRASLEDLEALCFDVAYWESRNNGGTLVHGVVYNPWTKKKFWHAWVERDGVVYDNKQHYLSVDDFYRMFKPKQVRRYNEEEAMINSVRAGHKGPWTRKELQLKARRKRR